MAKAQQLVIGALLLTAIVLVLVATAYLWGYPIIEKLSETSRWQVNKEVFLLIYERALEAARSCSQRSIEFKLDRGTFRISQSGNYIEYVTPATVPLVTSIRWVPINDNSLVGIIDTGAGVVGEDEPGVVHVVGSGSRDAYEATIRIKFRELEDFSVAYPQPGYIYRIQGDEVVGAGTHRLIITCTGREIILGGSKEGGDLIATYVSFAIR